MFLFNRRHLRHIRRPDDLLAAGTAAEEMGTPKNQSVQKAFLLLRSFRSAEEWVTNAELSRRTGLSEASAHRLMKTLEEIGVVVRDRRGSYRPGMVLASLSKDVAAGDLIRATSGDVLDGPPDADRCEHRPVKLPPNRSAWNQPLGVRVTESCAIGRPSHPFGGMLRRRRHGRVTRYPDSSGRAQRCGGVSDAGCVSPADPSGEYRP